MHDRAINNIKKIPVNYKINKKTKEIIIDIDYNIKSKEKYLLNRYINTFRDIDKYESIEKIKYFIIMRIIGTFNITNMSEDDFIACLAFIHLFFKSESNYIDYLISIVNKESMKKL